MGRKYFVYIMSNSSKMLYTGVTNDVDTRAFQHKSKLLPGFTQKYNLRKLVCFEVSADIRGAIRREKQIKGWLRPKKVALIESMNPHWLDLAKEHYESATRFNKKAANTKPLSSGGPVLAEGSQRGNSPRSQQSTLKFQLRSFVAQKARSSG